MADNSSILDLEAQGPSDDDDAVMSEAAESPTASDLDFIDDTVYPENPSLKRLARFSDVAKGASTTTTAKEPKKWRFNGKNFGLTYPQCTAKKEDLLKFLVGILDKYSPKIVVCEEDHHETDGQHLHASINCDKTFDTVNTKKFDYEGHHPHFEPTRNTTQWLQYVTKDGNYCVYPATFDVKDLLKARTEKKAPVPYQVALAIVDGQSELQIWKDHPGFMLLHHKLVLSAKQRMHLLRRQSIAKTNWANVKEFATDSGLFHVNNRIAGWLNENLLKERKFRQHMLWIWGPSGIGKTSLVNMLKKEGCNIHDVDLSTHFFDGITEETQLIVYDEFKAQRTITEMNKISDGASCRLDIKGSSFYKENPVAVLVLSNFSIDQAYCNSDQTHLETLKSRFLELHCDEQILVECRHFN